MQTFVKIIVFRFKTLAIGKMCEKWVFGFERYLIFAAIAYLFFSTIGIQNSKLKSEE
jgi:hypothetical protein